MDRVDEGLPEPGGGARSRDAIPAPSDVIGLSRSTQPVGIGRVKLFDLGQLDVDWEESTGILWAFMTPEDRPNYSMAMLRDSMRCLDGVRERFGYVGSPLRYMVVGSRFPGIFNLGGDLENFATWAEAGDRRALLDYGYLCVELIHRVWTSNHMPMINIALVQGDAFGGGMESMLCFDIIVAERQARFCLPEIKFGLYPGMGAYSLLTRKVGQVQAEKMIRGGRTYTAEEFYDMGLVTVLADKGQGEAALRDYVASIGPRHVGHLGVFEVGRRISPLTMDELRDIVELWADTALALPSSSIRMMRKIARAQSQITTSAGQPRLLVEEQAASLRS
jgi:DSF synthase